MTDPFLENPQAQVTVELKRWVFERIATIAKAEGITVERYISNLAARHAVRSAETYEQIVTEAKNKPSPSTDRTR